MAVYVIRAGTSDMVKIGFAVHVPGRVGELQCGNHEKLTLLRVIKGGRAVEAWLHRRFSSRRVHGEWFRLDDDMLSVEPPKEIDENSNASRVPVSLGERPSARTIRESLWIIRAYRLATGLSRKRLAAKAGLRDAVLRNIDKPCWNPTAKTLRRLEAVIPPEWMPSPPCIGAAPPPRERGDGAESAEPRSAHAEGEQPERAIAHDAEPAHEIPTGTTSGIGRVSAQSLPEPRPGRLRAEGLSSGAPDPSREYWASATEGAERVEGPHPSPAAPSASAPQ